MHTEDDFDKRREEVLRGQLTQSIFQFIDWDTVHRICEACPEIKSSMKTLEEKNAAMSRELSRGSFTLAELVQFNTAIERSRELHPEAAALPQFFTEPCRGSLRASECQVCGRPYGEWEGHSGRDGVIRCKRCCPCGETTKEDRIQ